jgi:hypothetical protein
METISLMNKKNSPGRVASEQTLTQICSTLDILTTSLLGAGKLLSAKH